MLLMLKPLRMLLMQLLLHRPKLRALLRAVVLVTVHLLAVVAVIVHLPVVVLLLHPLMVVMAVVGILLGLVQLMVRPVQLIGKVTIISLNKSSDILLKNIRVLLLFIGIRIHCITE